MLRIQRLTKLFSRNTPPAISEVSFDVNNGEIVGFVGLNGAGKTTTIRIVAGVTLPTEGTVRIDGKDIVDEKVEASSRIGWVPELPNFELNANAIDLMKYYAGYYGIVGAESNKIAGDLLRIFGLAGFEKKKLRSYSQGMKKRFSLAASMISDPPNYLFDEILNGLDPEGIHYFRNVVASLRGKGKAILLSSHLLSEIEELSDRIVLIHKGKVIKIVTKADLANFSTGTLFLRLNRCDDALLNYLNSFGKAHAENGLVAITDFSGDPSQVNGELVGKGYAVGELRLQRQSLEDYFLNLVAEAK